MSKAARAAYLRDWEMRMEQALFDQYGTVDGSLNYGMNDDSIGERVRLPSDSRKPEVRVLKLKGGGYGEFEVW
jgi:hypothetical protein